MPQIKSGRADEYYKQRKTDKTYCVKCNSKLADKTVMLSKWRQWMKMISRSNRATQWSLCWSAIMRFNHNVKEHFWLLQCLKETGTITSFLYGGKSARLQYEDSRTWLVNRMALFRVSVNSSITRSTVFYDVIVSSKRLIVLLKLRMDSLCLCLTALFIKPHIWRPFDY